MLQHSPTCCSIVHRGLQHGATCCNPGQYVVIQCTISQDRCARPAESNSGDRCSLRECAEHHARIQVVFMRGGQQAAGGMGGLGAGAGACSVRVARARVGCVGAKAPCG
jgi:hypothetical protein